MKQVAGKLKMTLAQYRELKAFAQFGSDLDKATREQLEQGAMLTEILKQPQYSPLSVERQIVTIYAATNGYLKGVGLDLVLKFEEELNDYIETRYSDLYLKISEKKAITGEIETEIKDMLENFTLFFKKQHGLTEENE